MDRPLFRCGTRGSITCDEKRAEEEILVSFRVNR